MVPDSANIVIVGGGAIGLSIAYHLAKLGVEDVLLLERNELTSGTSWHAAGIVGPLRASMNLTKLAKYATQLFASLEDETSQATGYKQTGGFWLAQNDDRMLELKRIAAMGSMNQIETQILSPDQIKQRCPQVNVDDLAGALWVGSDGQVNPVDLCMAYAKAARAGGVQIVEHASVVDVSVEDKGVKSIQLNNGQSINCNILVNACGVWAREFSRFAGLRLPIASCEHMYVVTEVMKGVPLDFPILRDLDTGIYIKGDSGKLVIGGFEANAKPWNPAASGSDSAYLMFDEDWDHIEPMLTSAMHRIPQLEQVGIQHFMNGPESFTPDTSQLMGKVSQLDNYFVAAGFNSIGIMSSAGVGKVMAQWIQEDCAPMDLWAVDVQRFEPQMTSDKILDERLAESVHSQFDMHWPFKQKKTARDVIHSPLHECFKTHGAVFAQSGIWERPFWFAQHKDQKKLDYSYADQPWWPIARREAQVLKDRVALIELSPFTKIKVSGRDCVRFLQRICTNNIDIETGKVVYTTMLNQRGGIESEHTVTRVSDEEFLLVSGAVTRLKDNTRLSNLATDYNVGINDISFDLAVIGVMGPHSRSLLQSLTQTDLTNSAFAFARSKLINLNGIQIRATRISFVGETGWELYIPKHQAIEVFNLLVDHGEQYQLGFVGHFCVDSCRLEKGYLHWGHDMGPDDSPFQVGLDFCVDMDKEFIGRDSLLKQTQQGVAAYLLAFAVESDSQPLLLHDEPIYCDQQLVGRTTSGGLGFRSGLALCNGFINTFHGQRKSDLLKRKYQLEVAGERFALRVLTQPVYDPNNLRLKG